MNEQIVTVSLTHEEWAKYYAQLGLRIIPLKPEGKTPIIKNWTQDATIDQDVISGWWAKLPEANIGVLTGQISSIVDIETDNHGGAVDGEAEFQSWCESNNIKLPETWAYRSGGGGIHRLYGLHTAIGSKTGILPGVDVKADKGQSVFPPSIHPNGNRYEWLPGCTPADMPQGPAQLPLELYDLIDKEQKKHVPLSLPDIVPEGQRDTLMFKFACKLRQTGLSGVELIAAMEAINDERCMPPLTDAEIIKKCEQAEQYPMGQVLSRIQNEAVVIDWEPLKHIKYSDLDDARRFAEFAYGKLAYTETRGGLKYSEGLWFQSKNAAASIIGDYADLEYDFAMSVCNKAKENEEMQPLAKECLKHAWKLRRKSTIDAIISLSVPYLTLPDEFFDAKPEELNTPGGVVDLKTGSIRLACPDDYFTQSTCVSATCTSEGSAMWSEMIERLTGGDTDFIRFLQMTAGMIAVGKVYQENCLFAVGSGRNGKSTFFNAIFRVLGSYATSIDPEVLLANKQNREVLLAGLRGKRFVLASETEEGVRLSSSALKRITSTDPIAAKQLYKDPMTFAPTHTLVLYTNHLPKVGSTDRGTWNRIKVVPFKTRWADNDQKTILNYCDVLVTKAGGDILLWMIEGARQYLAAGCKLSESLVMQEASTEYKTSEDWFQSFTDECCKIGPDYRVSAKELYEQYRYWAKTNGEYIRRRNDFQSALDEHGYSFVIPQNVKTYVGITTINGLGF